MLVLNQYLLWGVLYRYLTNSQCFFCGASRTRYGVKESQSVKRCISAPKGEPPGWLSGGLSGYPALRLNVYGLFVLGPTHYRMGEDIDIVVPPADVVIDSHYPVTASRHTRITAGVLAPTGYGIAIDTATPLGSDAVEAIKLIHNLQVIAGNVHPRIHVCTIPHEDAGAVIIDVQRTNTDILAGKDGILFG